MTTGAKIFLSLSFAIIMLSFGTVSCIVLEEKVIPSASGDLLFKDGFSHTRSGWDRVQKGDYIADYAEGVYRIYVSKPNVDIWSSPDLSFEDAIIQVDATKGGGPDDNNFGIFCRMDENASRFYYFVISSDGYYGIGKMTGGQQILLGDDVMQPSEHIHQGYAQNHIQAECVGERLSLSVNGNQIAEVIDQEYSAGQVGLLAGSFDTPGVDIYFDDFLVTKP